MLRRSRSVVTAQQHSPVREFEALRRCSLAKMGHGSALAVVLGRRYKELMIKSDHAKESPSAGETREVRATVIALIPRYHQAKIRSEDGHLYSITESTQGVRLNALREGQRLRCTVTPRLPRVVLAEVIA